MTSIWHRIGTTLIGLAPLAFALRRPRRHRDRYEVDRQRVWQSSGIDVMGPWRPLYFARFGMRPYDWERDEFSGVTDRPRHA